MSPLLRLCPRCGSTVTRAGLCGSCQKADDRRRNAKRRESGRATPRWQALRLAAFERDGYRCSGCGRTGTRHTLTAHLRPELQGSHWTAQLADVVTLCRHCHGSTDAPRAHGRRVLRHVSGR